MLNPKFQLLQFGTIGLLVGASLSAGCLQPTSALADAQVNPACVPKDSREIYNLTANANVPRKIVVNWDMCQPSEFYQVTWKGGGREDTAKIEGSNTKTWNIRSIRDETKYTIKLQGCKTLPDQKAECTPGMMVTVTTPDW